MAAFSAPAIAKIANQRARRERAEVANSTADANRLNLPQKPASGGRPANENMKMASAPATRGCERPRPANSSTSFRSRREELRYARAAQATLVGSADAQKEEENAAA